VKLDGGEATAGMLHPSRKFMPGKNDRKTAKSSHHWLC